MQRNFDSRKDLIQLGGATIVKNNSLHELLVEQYPDYDWLPWKFHNCPKNYWKDNKNIHKFMKWVENQLGIKELNDWYNVSFTVFQIPNYIHSFFVSVSPKLAEDIYSRTNPAH